MTVETTYDVNRVGASLELIYRIRDSGAKIVIGPRRITWPIDQIEIRDGGGQFTADLTLASMTPAVKSRLMEGVNPRSMWIDILINGYRLRAWAMRHPLWTRWSLITMGDMIAQGHYIGPHKIAYAMTLRDYRADREAMKVLANL